MKIKQYGLSEEDVPVALIRQINKFETYLAISVTIQGL